jgi:hypothetical protein
MDFFPKIKPVTEGQKLDRDMVSGIGRGTRRPSLRDAGEVSVRTDLSSSAWQWQVDRGEGPG